LEDRGLASVYHETTGEQQGQELTPTIYWRDRSEAGPTYHLDYIFPPTYWLKDVREFNVGSFDNWCGSGLSDHLPLVVDVRV
ncbi:MAG: endonuclease/exonuclease/phosphatase family protein, partial [Acidimicrobiia bacterium]|nr:endonuclease/exonuclease/phosphatase family protein [Acidimicrobiia bacterium]